MKGIPCLECGAEIVFLRTPKGKRMPVNAETVKDELEIYSQASGHVNHWSTCTKPDQFRDTKKGSPPG